MTIAYTEELEGVRPEHLVGFFVGWPAPPTPERHLEILAGSDHVVLAKESDCVVGFATAISDGVVSAYVPLLEVLPAYQSQGIGAELMKRLLARLEQLYMVDLCCDAHLESYYARFGFRVLERGMGLRRPEALRP